MISLFIKIFIIGTIIPLVWFISKKTLKFFAPLLRDKKYLKQLQHLIDQSIYDKQTILRAIKLYSPPQCQDKPPNLDKIRTGKYGFKLKDLNRETSIFLKKKSSCKHLLILGDSGMGKTTFTLNFYLHNKNKSPISIVPLSLKNSDKMISSITDSFDTLLILDGLDEDVKAFKNPLERLIQLMDKTKEFKKIVITSSLNFIPRHKLASTNKGFDIAISKDSKNNRMYKLQRLYLPQLTLGSAQRLLDHRLSLWDKGRKKKALQFIHGKDLNITPFTLSYIPWILRKIPEAPSNNLIYQKIINLWIKEQHHWKDKTKLNDFIGKLAADLFLMSASRGEESIPKDALVKKAKTWGITPKPFRKDIDALVCQTRSGYLKFSHRTIMEYLTIRQLLSGDKSCHQAQLTFGMKNFLFESLEEGQEKTLKPELEWLYNFELKAQGLKPKSQQENTALPSLFRSILNKNTQYNFLTRLPKLFQNPIFSEFGWDPELFTNLNKAFLKKQSSFMRQEKKRWDILINYQKIELTKRGRETKQIPLTQIDYKEYAGLQNDSHILQLNNAVGLKGLRFINNINLSKRLAILPDLRTSKSFTLFFWSAH